MSRILGTAITTQNKTAVCIRIFRGFTVMKNDLNICICHQFALFCLLYLQIQRQLRGPVSQACSHHAHNVFIFNPGQSNERNQHISQLLSLGINLRYIKVCPYLAFVLGGIAARWWLPRPGRGWVLCGSPRLKKGVK